MLWILAFLGYLTFGNITGRFVAFDYNDETDSKKLPMWRKVLRRFAFPVRSWGWNMRMAKYDEQGQLEDFPTPIVVALGGIPRNKTYIACHTFLWPLMRTPSVLSEVARLIGWTLYVIFASFAGSVLWIFDAAFRAISGNKGQKLEYLQKFQEEISGNKTRIQEVLEQAEKKMEHIVAAITEAEKMRGGELEIKVAALIVRLQELQGEHQQKLSSARDALATINEAENKIADYNRLLVLYQATADLADTSQEQDEIFEASLSAIKAVREASRMFSEESTRAMINADVPYEVVEASVRADVRNEAKTDRHLLN